MAFFYDQRQEIAVKPSEEQEGCNAPPPERVSHQWPILLFELHSRPEA